MQDADLDGVVGAGGKRCGDELKVAPKASALAPASKRRREMLKTVATSLSSVMGDPWLCLTGVRSSDAPRPISQATCQGVWQKLMS